MTALRPERDTGSPYGEPYGESGTFEAAVGRLHDPLNDPLPGQAPDQAPGHGTGSRALGHVPHQLPRQEPEPPAVAWPGARPEHGPLPGAEAPSTAYGQGYADPHARAYGTPQEPAQAHLPLPPENPPSYTPADAWRVLEQTPAPEGYAAPQEPTMGRAARRAAARRRASGPAGDAPPAADGREPAAGADGLGDERTVALRVDELRNVAGGSAAVGAPAGGRAARRKAAQGGGRRRAGHGRRAAGPAASAASGTAAAAPLSRVEARRQARARKDPPSVIASRVLGETFITIGVLMLLFVTYQLWYTNVLAQQEAGGAASNLQKEWDGKGARSAGAFSPGQGFAIMYIPKLDVKVPIAEGIDKNKVLDHGMVGHYADGKLKTAMPWDKKGNFAVAGHRNTHGEPFRYINRLNPGDEIIVETQRTFYTYEMASILPQTPPSNTDVIKPVPPGSGFTGPGRYITLTTCTPEFTSTYRMIVWGRMVDERARSQGKPDALVG
ncbi:class E sortase [Streptomyces sp. NPDC001922]|uniref:class E sortase n=1 Tax=Streptomyces sp. NPDC001922 TaxID=3364624 RepID=UPI00368FE561